LLIYNKDHDVFHAEALARRISATLSVVGGFVHPGIENILVGDLTRAEEVCAELGIRYIKEKLPHSPVPLTCCALVSLD
jgi:hypothetical protein